MTTEEQGTRSRFADGLEVRRHVMGEEYVQRAFANAAGTDSAALQTFVTDTVWGGVWTRSGLDYRSRSLLNLGILIALRAHDELAGHVRGALRNGLSRHEISETVIHTAGYCGAPAALAAMRIVQKVFDDALGPPESVSDN
ncbi:carboxymuconolactone decarboxylase family protein [Rhodococcus sp. NPDC057297]|uniref:carboxymuconolactone decarboxylase family protein n=1 Tax=Rhodococcus sp. NPDC057297 TaxID=3346090 RepID=UPI0036339BE6